MGEGGEAGVGGERGRGFCRFGRYSRWGGLAGGSFRAGVLLIIKYIGRLLRWYFSKALYSSSKVVYMNNLRYNRDAYKPFFLPFKFHPEPFSKFNQNLHTFAF